jgi:hypothetical protein
MDEVEYYDLHNAICAGVESLKKTYSLMDHTDIHVLTLGKAVDFMMRFFIYANSTFTVLNPRWKMKYIEKRWDQHYIMQARKMLYSVVRASIFSAASVITTNY